jgi:hypothetical protein
MDDIVAQAGVHEFIHAAIISSVGGGVQDWHETFHDFPGLASDVRLLPKRPIHLVFSVSFA